MRNRIWGWLHLLLGISLVTLIIAEVIKLPSLYGNYIHHSQNGASISLSGIILLKSAPLWLTWIVCLIFYILVERHNKKNNILPILIDKDSFIKKIPIWGKLTGCILCIIILFLIIVYDVQDDLLYYPSKSKNLTQRLLKQDEMSEVHLDNCECSGLLYSSNSDKVIIYFGGNAQNSAYFFEEFYKKGYNELAKNIDVLCVDYPGYGNSKGSPNEEAIYEMALNEYGFASEHYKEVVVVGYSLGTGAAAYASANCGVERTYLLAPYSSMTDVYNTILPIFYGPCKLLVKNKYNSCDFVKNINSPVVIFASEDDEVIPYELSTKLSKRNENIRMVTLSEKHHNDISLCEEAWSAILQTGE